MNGWIQLEHAYSHIFVAFSFPERLDAFLLLVNTNAYENVKFFSYKSYVCQIYKEDFFHSVNPFQVAEGLPTFFNSGSRSHPTFFATTINCNQWLSADLHFWEWLSTTNVLTMNGKMIFNKRFAYEYHPCEKRKVTREQKKESIYSTGAHVQQMHGCV